MVHCEFEESYKVPGEEICIGAGLSDSESRIYDSYMRNNWTQVAESTMPLKASKQAAANRAQLLASIEIRSRQISTKVILVNLSSLFINLLLAIIAFYFSFVNNSSSTTAFAADCVLDFMSSAIVLWRYHGDLSSVCMHAREQIACIYLGVLFEISAFGIIIKSLSDMLSYPTIEVDNLNGANELVYLAIAATIACSVLTVFKCNLYKTLRDNSILLDVINTVVSTVFAMSIVMSQVLISVNPSFWYLDPILGIVLALFMMGFGVKVIHQNFNIMTPVYQRSQLIHNSHTESFHSLMPPLLGGSTKISDIPGENNNYNDFNGNSYHQQPGSIAFNNSRIPLSGKGGGYSTINLA